MEMLARPTVLSIVPASAKRPFLLAPVGGKVADSRVWDGVRDLRRGCVIASWAGSAGDGGVEEALLGPLTPVLLFRGSAGGLSLSGSELAEVPKLFGQCSRLGLGDKEGMTQR